MNGRIQNLQRIREWENNGVERLKQELLSAFAEYASDVDVQKLSLSLDFGEKVHGHQKRETGVMYFTHPLIVALLMMPYKPSLSLLIATVLHDAIEDGLDDDISQQIETLFGAEVKTLIEGASNVKNLQTNKTSKEETLKKIFTFSSRDARTLIIKVFDRLHNIITLSGKKSPEKREKKLRETLDIYLPAIEFLGLWKIKKILEDACFIYLFPAEVERIEELRTQSHKQGMKMKSIFEDQLNTQDIEVEVKYKSFWSLWKRGIEDVTPSHFYFLRLVVENEEKCYTTLALLNEHFIQRSNTLIDTIAYPKENGYGALQAEYIVNNSIRVHVHIVSKELKERNDKGIFIDFYKNQYTLNALKTEYIDNIVHESTDFQSFLTGDLLVEKIPLHSEEYGEFSLPKGATLLDALLINEPNNFIYAEEGYINESKKDWFTPLKKDDILSFTVGDKQEVYFQQEWLEYTNTYISKKSIQKYLQSRSDRENEKAGISILQNTFDTAREGEIPKSFLETARVLSFFQVKNQKELYMLIGSGLISASEVLELFLENKKTSLFEKISHFFFPSARTHELTFSFESNRLSGKQIQDIFTYHSKANDSNISSFSLNSQKELNTGIVTLNAETESSLVNTVHHVDWDPRITIKESISSGFIFKILRMMFLPLLFVGSAFLLMFFGSNTLDERMFYVGAFLVALGNTMGYSILLRFFPNIRFNNSILFLFIGINVLVSSIYIFLFWQKNIDFLGASFYFPLLVIFSSMAFPAFIFRQKEKKALPTISQDEWEQKKKDKMIGYMARFGAVVIWGITPLLLRYSPVTEVSTDIRILLIAFGAALFSAITILFIPRGIQKIVCKIPINRYLIILILSLIFVLFFNAKSLEYTSSTNFLLLSNFGPVFALLVAFVFWRSSTIYFQDKKSTYLIFLIFLLGSVGSSFLFFNDLQLDDKTSLIGNILALFFMIIDVIFITAQIQYSKVLQTYQSYFVNFYLFSAAFIVLLPIVLYSSADLFSNVSLESLLWTIGLGLIWGLGVTLNYEAFRRMDGFIAFLMFNLSVLITFVVEAFILESIPTTLLLITGGAMIIGASIVAEIINTRCEKQQLKT